jgi:23S rRNA pseudouridine1911/1915/1917 synthase
MPATILTVGQDAGDSPGSYVTGESQARLDRWLALQLPEHSRTLIQRWIKEGNVLVNAKPGRANQRLLPGDLVQLTLPEEPRTTNLAAEAIPIEILYEDNDIVVVNKPAGLVVHPSPGHGTGTLVNAILHHVPELAGISGEVRPGIVHRLDKDTSGVMVVAKHDAALRNLQSQFKSRKVDKRYLALLEGKIEEKRGQIVAPIGRDLRDRKKMAVLMPSTSTTSRSRPAITEFEVLARYTVAVRSDIGRGTFTLVQAHPITGRTHQIRVHFLWLGHPLVGDPIYGLRHQRLHSPRLFLHARQLSFALPSNGAWVQFTAELPPDLQEVLDRLELGRSG